VALPTPLPRRPGGSPSNQPILTVSSHTNLTGPPAHQPQRHHAQRRQPPRRCSRGETLNTEGDLGESNPCHIRHPPVGWPRCVYMDVVVHRLPAGQPLAVVHVVGSVKSPPFRVACRTLATDDVGSSVGYMRQLLIFAASCPLSQAIELCSLARARRGMRWIDRRPLTGLIG
jgi:hypothetical protein